MSSNHVTELVKPKGEVVEQKPLLRGYISGAVGSSKALLTAPAAFPKPNSEQNYVWVVVPEYSTERPLGPCNWAALHGSRLPKQFAKVVVAIDAEGVPTVLWWEGEQKEAEGGGKEYKAKSAGGLELGGAETNEFAVKAEGITAGFIGPEAVETAKIKAFAVTTIKIATENVTEVKIANLNVTTSKLAASAVTEGKLGAEAVSTAKLKLLAVTEAILAAEAVGEAKIAKEAVTNEKIKAAAGIEESKLSLPEVIVKTGEQTITATKNFEPSPLTTSAWTAITSGSTATALTASRYKYSVTKTAESIDRCANAEGTVTYSAKNKGEIFQMFRNGVTFATTGNLEMGSIAAFQQRLTLSPESGSTTTNWHIIAAECFPILTTVGAGKATTNITGLKMKLTAVGEGWTIPFYRAVFIENPTKGTPEKCVGVHVPALTAGTENFSILSEGATVKLKHAGPIEMTKGFAAWAHSPPGSQHAALPAPKTLLEVEAWAAEVDAVFKEYGLTA